MFFGQDCWCRCCRHIAIFLSVTNSNNTGQNASSFSHLVYNRNGSPVTLPSRQCLCARWQTKLYSDSEVYKELLIHYIVQSTLTLQWDSEAEILSIASFSQTFIINCASLFGNWLSFWLHFGPWKHNEPVPEDRLLIPLYWGEQLLLFVHTSSAALTTFSLNKGLICHNEQHLSVCVCAVSNL